VNRVDLYKSKIRTRAPFVAYLPYKLSELYMLLSEPFFREYITTKKKQQKKTNYIFK